MEFSTLIGKPVLTSSGKHCGYAVRAYVTKDLSALSCLLCADRDEEEFIVPASAVGRVGDAILAGKARLKSPSGIPCPVGKGAFDEQGGFLGGVSKLTDGPRGILTVTGLCGDREFPARVVNADQIVVIRDSLLKSKSLKGASRQKSAETEENEICEDSPSPKGPELGKKEDDNQEILSDEEIFRTDLLGKRVQRNVEGLCLKGEKVTCSMIRRAHETNRLLELKSVVLTR